MNRIVLKTVGVLEIISGYNEISPADLAKVTGYPKTSVYDIPYAPEERVVMYGCTDKVCYSIGFRAYAIGRPYPKNSNLLSNSYRCMRALAEDTGKAVLLGKIDGERILYIAKYEPKHPVVMAPLIGDRESVKNTAFAKIAEVFTRHEKEICQLSREEKNRIRMEKPASYGLDGPDPSYNIVSPVHDFKTGLSEVAGVSGVRGIGVDYSEELEKVRECAGKISE